MNEIKLAIVDDDRVWLESMTCFLNNEEDMKVVATASNKEDAVEMALNNDVDVILMDIKLDENNHDGIYATAEICQIKKVKIIMLTSLESEEVITDSFTAGALSYITKNNYTEIPTSIRTLNNSKAPIEILLKEFGRLKQEEQLSQLSAAEREILYLVEKGYSQTQISEMLFKSHGTIKSQINKLLKKLKVSSCKEAIKKIRSKGLLR